MKFSSNAEDIQEFYETKQKSIKSIKKLKSTKLIKKIDDDELLIPFSDD